MLRSNRDSEHLLDVYRWRLTGPDAEGLRYKAKYPGEREGTIAAELMVEGDLPTFELMAMWSGLAEDPSDVITYVRHVDSLKCRLDQNVREFGCRVVLNDDVIPAIVVRRNDADRRIMCRFSTDYVRRCLLIAKRALLNHKYETAARLAVAARELCPKLAAVNKLLGTLLFHGVKLDDNVASAVCWSISRRRQALEFGVVALTCMWTNGSSPTYELAVREAIAAFHEELYRLQPVFQMAMARVSPNLF